MIKTTLKTIIPQPVSHNHQIFKKVFLKKGQVLNITQIAQIQVRPGQVANAHTHMDMYEIFYFEEGEGLMEVDKNLIKVSKGDCITVEPGESHEITNNSQSLLLFIVIGVEEFV